MSVDTNVKGKNLAPYRRVGTELADVRVLVSPKLIGLASRMVVTTRGRWQKRLTVELADDRPDAPTNASCEL